MKLSAISLALTRAGFMSSAFTPALLFAASEPGVWFDASDMSTMFQDAAGTTPVTAMEQPCGLWLDKSRGLTLGSEAAVNGGFDSDTAWTKDSGWTISSGTANSANAGGTFNNIRQSVLTANKWYLVTFTVSGYVSGTCRVRLGDSNSFDATANGTYTWRGQATGTFATFLHIFAWNGGTFSVDNISVKELPGNHASQSTAASRPVLSARVNLLTRTEEFDNAYWAKNATTVSANAATAPDGTTTADKVTADGTNTQHYVTVLTSWPSGASHRLTCSVKKDTADFAHVLVTGINAYVQISLVDGSTVFSSTGTGTNVSFAVESQGNGWYRVTLTATQSSGSAVGFRIYPLAASSNTAGPSEASTASMFVWGADLRLTADATAAIPAYQRVVTASDYDSAGFPTYLRFDGVDDSLSTGSINFTSTDKVTCFAGVHKSSDAANAAVVELGDSVENTFSLLAPLISTANSYSFGSRGAEVQIQRATAGPYAAPISNVVTGTANIAGSSVVLRVNGTQAATAGTSQGTGNYRNDALHIGRRGGSTLPFNGRLTQLIVRGATTSADQIAATERVIAGRTGVTLLQEIYDFIMTDAGDSVTTDAGDTVITDTYYA
jgi:hypothetical protein